MTAANAHTPTYEVYYDDSVIELPSRRLICHPHRLDDAERIVAALNERAALLAALQRIVSKYDHMRANYDQGDWRLVLKHWGELADEARTALAQAQKGTP